MKVLARPLGSLALPLLGMFLLAPLAAALWLGPTRVPIERILPQLERRVAEHPDDAHGHYLLGRVHGAAYSQGVGQVCLTTTSGLEGDVRTREGGGAVESREIQTQFLRRDKDLTRLTSDERLTHLGLALTHLSTAVRRAPDDALYRIGLAYVLDDGAAFAAEVGAGRLAPEVLPPLSDADRELATEAIEALGKEDTETVERAEERLSSLGSAALPLLDAAREDPDVARRETVGRLLTRAWQELAIAQYERAFVLAFGRDRENEHVMYDTRSNLVSYEAAQSYIRMVEARGPRDENEKARLAEIRAGLETLEKIPTWITPILVPDASDATLASLFDGSSATFDLSGAGLEQTWSWPTAAASFLVWDPQGSGEITSGRQLVGSATWWMFFEDGYHVLAALDTDGDGWLRGPELDGLALWRDADRDGRSDPGEVTTLASRGLIALATTADGLDGLSPTCARGALFVDGRARPTFDWVTSPLPPKP